MTHKHENCHVHQWQACHACQVYYCTVPGCEEEKSMGYLAPWRWPWVTPQPYQPYQPYNPWLYDTNTTGNDPSPRGSLTGCAGHSHGA